MMKPFDDTLGVLSKGYEIFGNGESLKENPIQHLFEVKLIDVWCTIKVLVMKN